MELISPNYLLIMFQTQLPFLPLIFSSLVLLVTLVIYFRKRLTNNEAASFRLPPGPRKLPLIGNLHQLASSGSLPHHSLRDLANKHGPIMHLKLGEVTAIVISSPDAAKEVFKTHEAAFLQRPAGVDIEIFFYGNSGMVFSPYNEYWRQMRKVCVLELLSAKRVQSFRLIREEEARNLVQSIASLSPPNPAPINLSEKIFSMKNSITARAALGKKCKHQEEFISLIKEAIAIGGGFDLTDLFPSLKFLKYVTSLKPAVEKLHRKVDKILDDVINEHKAKSTNVQNQPGAAGDDHEDLVNVLLSLQDSGGLPFDLTTNHIKAVTLEMYAAGSDTSATATEWAMSELLRNPRAMEKAQAEVRRVLAGKTRIEAADMEKLEYLKLVIKETLRLHPPATLITREASERCKLSGYDIPVQSKVLINVWAIGRDAKHWGENADCFQPERFQGSSIDFRGTNFELIPFGSGKRMCPGVSFGIASVELALSQLLYHFDWKLPNGMNHEELDMTESMGMNAKRKNDLYAIAISFISE